jgi:hypothetical protein
MASTIKQHNGLTSSENITANAAGVTTSLYYRGRAKDPLLYGGAVAGRYIKEVGTTYRWIEDFPLATGSTMPVTYTAESI